MTLADLLGVQLPFNVAAALAILAALGAGFLVIPRAIHKLRGAGIMGRDQNKPGAPEIPEMGGIAVFLAFNVGAFTALALGDLHPLDETLVLASLVVAAGATITGVLDDLVVLRQRFKAIIPFAFAAPLALYVSDTTVSFPFIGAFDFGLLYPLLLVPVGVACASNGFNMLEGFNGLGTGLGIILAGTLSLMAILTGNLAGLALLFPLIGALLAFRIFNTYPARVFPGDTMTLLVGAVLGTAAIVSKIEFWGALLFVPHIVEFLLKLRAGFKAECFASQVEGGRLHHEGPIRSLTHIVMQTWNVDEPRLVARMHALMLVYAGVILVGFLVVEASIL